MIVVTGAAGGQGAAEVVALHDEGATVIAADLHEVDGRLVRRTHLETDVEGDLTEIPELAGQRQPDRQNAQRPSRQPTPHRSLAHG